MLAISMPFKVEEVAINEIEQTITIQLKDTRIKKRLFKKQTNNISKWHHIPLGQFSVNIELEDNEPSYTNQFDEPMFIGKKEQAFTAGLKSQVAYLYSLKLTPSDIASLCLIDERIVDVILADIPGHKNTILNEIPNAGHYIWLDVLENRIHIKDKSLALFLKRLKINAYSNNSSASTKYATDQIHQYFLKNSDSLKNELEQLNIFLPAPRNDEQSGTQPADTESKKTTITLDNPVWDFILSGKGGFIRSPVQFSLKLTKLISDYRDNDSDKTKVIEDFVRFINTNKSTLSNEIKKIKQIAESLSGDKKNEYLPPIKHALWNNIIGGNAIIETNNVKFNLFLSSLKNGNQPNKEASLRAFLSRNETELIHEIEEIRKLMFKGVA